MSMWLITAKRPATVRAEGDFPTARVLGTVTR
jgi:hypothetical protein